MTQAPPPLVHTTPQSDQVQVTAAERASPQSPSISALRNGLSCSNCKQAFNCLDKLPLTLNCGHTICKACTTSLVSCPLETTPTPLDEFDIQKVPVNYAILQLVMDLKGLDEASHTGMHSSSAVSLSPSGSSYHLTPSPEIDPDMALDRAKQCLDELAEYLVLGSQGAGGEASLPATSSSHLSPAHTSIQNLSGHPHILSRPLQRKLASLSNCSLSDEDGRVKLLRATRSIGERCVNELIVIHQNPQMLTSHLWAAVRQRGCQFLGPQMQDNTLQLIHFLLRDGEQLQRKSIVLFVVSRLEKFPSASKTNVGHVVQLLYRASCFNVTKRKDASSLLQLKEEYRQYEFMRREHDAQIIQIAYEAGLRISPEQWSSLIYGDLQHKSHMQSIIDKLQTPQSFYNSIHELVATLKKSGDVMNLSSLKPSLELIASINSNPGEKAKVSWENLLNYLEAVCHIMDKFVNFLKVSGKGKNVMSSYPESSYNSPTQTRNITAENGMTPPTHSQPKSWELTPVGSSTADSSQNTALSHSFDSGNRFNSPIPGPASPFRFSSPVSTTFRNTPSGYRQKLGTFPNYPQSISPHGLPNKSDINAGMPTNPRTRESPNTYTRHLQYGMESPSDLDASLYRMSSAQPPTRRPSQSAYQTQPQPWISSYPIRPPSDQLNRPPFSLPVKDTPDFADPYTQQQYRSLPEFKLAQGCREESLQRFGSLSKMESSINSNSSSEMDPFPFLSPKPHLPPPPHSLSIDMNMPTQTLPEDPQLFKKFNALPTLFSELNVGSPGSIYSSGYSSIPESPGDQLSSASDSYKPYQPQDRPQDWLQVRCKELAEKEEELNMREAYIKQKEEDYFIDSSSSTDKYLQEFLDKELAKELQRGEMPPEGYQTFSSDQDQLDPILNQIIRNLHIDN